MFKCEAWQLRIPYSCAGRSVTPVLFSLLPLGVTVVYVVARQFISGAQATMTTTCAPGTVHLCGWHWIDVIHSLTHPLTHSLTDSTILQGGSPINKRGDVDYDGGKYCIRYEFPYLFILGIISFYRVHGSNEPKLRGILIFSGLNWRPSMLAGHDLDRGVESAGISTHREIPSDLSDCGDT